MLLLLELLQKFIRGRAKYVMNFVHLIEFVIAWEEWKQGEDFEVDAAHSPVVHLVVIVAVC